MKNKSLALGRMLFAVVFFSALLLAPSATLSISADAVGSNSSSHIAQVEKPNASATVLKAFVLAASTGFSGRVLNNGDGAINGTPINWDAQVFGAIGNSNHR